MPLVKIGPKHQITIPKDVFQSLHLESGDLLEVIVQDGKGIFIPKQIIEKAPAPKLSKKEQSLLTSAREKIQAIQKSLRTAQGLTRSEVEVAVKVGLIDADQKWWWTEEWQRLEQKAEEDIKMGKTSNSFETVDDLIKDLEN